MRIESGSTGEWKARVGIFFVMCTFFALYFVYDGFWGYPNKNLKWARDTIGDTSARLRVNPKVSGDTLKALQEKVKKGEPIALGELDALFGPPTHVQPEQFV